TYRRAGITPDPATWARAAPLLADLADALRTTPDPTIVATSATGVVASSGEAPPGGVGAGLAGRLHPFLHGAYRGLLSGPTTLATQDVDDVLGTELGRAVVTNAATQILLRQAPQTLDHVARVFGLSGGEQAFLQRATPGRGLLLGSRRVAFHAVAAATEHALITADPRDPTPRADPDDDPDVELPTK